MDRYREKINYCEFCGTSFHPCYCSPNQRFCSYEHYHKYLQAGYPDRTTLEDLYTYRGQSLSQVARKFCVSGPTVAQWLRYYKIKVRGKGSRRYPLPPPRSELAHLILEEKLPFSAIANRYNTTPATICRWARGYGIKWEPGIWTRRLQARHFREPLESELKQLYIIEQQSLNEIANRFECSKTLIKNRLLQYGIAIKNSGWQRNYHLKNGMVVKSIYEQRVGNWLLDHDLPFEYGPPLPFNHRMRGDFLVHDIYIEIWGVDESNRIYQEQRTRKLKLYKSSGLKLISISHWDFRKANKERWKRKLENMYNLVIYPNI